MEVVDGHGFLLANGNIMKEARTDNKVFEWDIAEVQKKLQVHKEEARLEKQFGEMILHVIENMEKENNEDGLHDPAPELSLLDMKRFLKSEITVTGVSENSPIQVLESVNGKVGQILHNFNIFEICQLAACTRVELSHILKQAKGSQATDLEFAHQDAKGVMSILAVTDKDTKKDKNPSSWNTWGGLSQVTKVLQIKESSKKIADIVGSLSPKTLTASFFSQREGEDIDTFTKI